MWIIKYIVQCHSTSFEGEITLDTDRYNEIRAILSDQFGVGRSFIEIYSIQPCFDSYL